MRMMIRRSRVVWGILAKQFNSRYRCERFNICIGHESSDENQKCTTCSLCCSSVLDTASMSDSERPN
jgi:hypothetical protein